LAPSLSTGLGVPNALLKFLGKAIEVHESASLHAS
jgi:hypothetical protein